jgi:hypothetical protein
MPLPFFRELRALRVKKSENLAYPPFRFPSPKKKRGKEKGEAEYVELIFYA